MKNTTSLVTSFLLIVASSSALAMDIRGERTSFYERNKPKPIGLNYTFLEIGYLNSTAESSTSNNDNKVQSIDAKVSFAVTKQTSGSLKITGGAYTINNSFVASTEIHAGGQYHYPIAKKVDVYGAIKLISISLEDPNSTQSVSASGRALTVGLRQKLSETFEWEISATFLEIEDDSYTQTQIGLAYGDDKDFQYIAGYKSSDSDDKQKSFSLGIRLNYE